MCGGQSVDPGTAPYPGGGTYLKDLLTFIQSDDGAGLDIDANIFVGIFMCLVASGGANLIIEVDDQVEYDDDETQDSIATDTARAIARVVRMAELICSNVFRLRTRHVSVGSNWQATDLSSTVRFFGHPPSPSSESPKKDRKVRRRKSSLSDVHSLSTPRFRRSPSPARLNERSKSADEMQFGPRAMSEGLAADIPSPIEEKAEEGAVSQASKGANDGVRVNEAQPTSTTSDFPSGRCDQLDPPDVLVLTDLEQADRFTAKSLASILRSQRIPLDGGKREILDDPFSRLRISSSRRKPSRDHRTAPPFSSKSAEIRHSTKQLPGVIYNADDTGQCQSRYGQSHKATVNNVQESSNAHTATDTPTRMQELPLPNGFLCIWIKKMLTPINRIDHWMVDRFSFRCRASVNAAYGAGQYAEPMQEPTGRLKTVITQEYLTMVRSLSYKTHMHPPLRLFISNLTSGVQHHPRLNSNITATSITNFKAFVRISRIIFRPFSWSPENLDLTAKGRQYDQRNKLREAMDRAEWFATDEDVRNVFGNLIEFRVSHRSNRDQILWPLKGGADGRELMLEQERGSGTWKSTVKNPEHRSRDAEVREVEDRLAVQAILARLLDIV